MASEVKDSRYKEGLHLIESRRPYARNFLVMVKGSRIHPRDFLGISQGF